MTAADRFREFADHFTAEHAQSFAALRQRIARARIGQHWPGNPTKHTHAEIAAGLQRRREREESIA